ncbi:hypothetical protein MUO14_17705 [Halobacillus shinanisalinarum]|uniref:Uncharacterized protein n=1 Tax=Halobacillus shinanisalinarum TaxID=2932258 RepID=A0ABY4GWF8_9BACI|nr:hypothetical protein [Halobacillus shinanisalinarum]UOQ92294.1 hypothetical protein MUO14_17705 [Halobacillus shinanisalinarum]
MKVLAVILISIGLILAPIIGFLYPDWRIMQGKEELSEWQQYGIHALAIGVLLIMFVFANLLIE